MYLPALDGLRAVAVGAVFLFHSGVVSGGFIGVDVFFVISGFLITGLAVAEVERTDRLSIGAFWARRARRLLPALLVVVAAVLVHSVAEGGAALRRVGRDVASTILYVANWAQIGEGRDYFATYEAPPLLEHAWSLAVEEQFYIVWPVVIAGLAWACRGRVVRFRMIVAGVGVAVAVASLLTTITLRGDGVSLGRLYYGTDTHAVGLAIGAVAGALMHHDHVMSLQRRSVARDVAGMIAACALIVIAVTIDGRERWLYGPGFLLHRGAVAGRHALGDRRRAVGYLVVAPGARDGRDRVVRHLSVALAGHRRARQRPDGPERPRARRAVGGGDRSVGRCVVVRRRASRADPHPSSAGTGARLHHRRPRSGRRSGRAGQSGEGDGSKRPRTPCPHR